MFPLFGKVVAGKDIMWYQTGEETALKPRWCPMPQPILSLGENRQRLHSPLGYVSPSQFEQRMGLLTH